MCSTILHCITESGFLTLKNNLLFSDTTSDIYSQERGEAQGRKPKYKVGERPDKMELKTEGQWLVNGATLLLMGVKPYTKKIGLAIG